MKKLKDNSTLRLVSGCKPKYRYLHTFLFLALIFICLSILVHRGSVSFLFILLALTFVSIHRETLHSDETSISGSIAVICAVIVGWSESSLVVPVACSAVAALHWDHLRSFQIKKIAVNLLSTMLSTCLAIVVFLALIQSKEFSLDVLAVLLVAVVYWCTNNIIVSFAIAISNRENILKTIWLLIRSDLAMLVFGFAGALCGVAMLTVSPWVGIVALVSLLVLLDVFVISAPTGLAAIRQNWFLLTVRFGATIMAGVVGAVVTRAFDISVLGVLLGLLAAFVSAVLVVALAVLARLGSSWPAWRRPDSALVSGIVALEILIPLAGGLIGVLWVTAGPTVAIVVASATLIGISLGVLWRRHRPESEPIDEELALGAVMLAMFDGLPDSVDSH